MGRAADCFSNPSSQNGQIRNPLVFYGNEWTPRDSRVNFPNIHSWGELLSHQEMTKFFESDLRMQKTTCKSSRTVNMYDREDEDRSYKSQKNEGNVLGSGVNANSHRPQRQYSNTFQGKENYNLSGQKSTMDIQDDVSFIQANSGISRSDIFTEQYVTIEQNGMNKTIPWSVLLNLSKMQSSPIVIINKIEVLVQGANAIPIGTTFSLLSINERGFLDVTLLTNEGHDIRLHLMPSFFTFL